MMYWPKHRPQLTGIPTAAVDCGIRATQMGLDAITDGKVIRSVAAIRRVMGDQDETNYEQWDAYIDELGGKTLGFSAAKTNEMNDVLEHLATGGFSILAVDYGDYRRGLQSKSGSLTFSGYHGILFGGWRKRNGVRQVRSFDSLLDGRYAGCPRGPVWVPVWRVTRAALAVGRKEVGQRAVFAVNLYRDASVAPTEPGDLLPGADAPSTLIDVLSDLYAADDPSLADTIADIERIIGITVTTDADAATPVLSGIALRAK
jgi:hypothetical protein